MMPGSLSVSRGRRRRIGLSLVLSLPGIAAGAGVPNPEPVVASTTPTCGASGVPSVVALANPNFYVDNSLTPVLDSNYAGYTVRAGTSSIANPRLVLSGFTGGSIGLAPGQSPSIAFPTLAAGATHTSYFLLKAASLTTTAQTHTITLYNGAIAMCERTFSFNRVADTIQANANKVRTVTANVPTEVSIGDAVTVTVEGDTGTLGSGPSFDPGILSYAPTAYGAFPASAWRLERTEMTISPDGTAAAQTYVDRLFLAGASGSDRPYTARYTFRAVGPSSTTTSVIPVQYIASGTQVKHTSISNVGLGALPTVAGTASLTLAKTADRTEFPLNNGVVTGGTVTYTVTASNTGTAAGTLDEIVDTLPAGATYLGSATVNGRSQPPLVSGQNLTWYGPFTVPAGGQLRVSYQVTIPNTAGTYVNSAIARYGGQQIDSSGNLTSDDPATATVVVIGSSSGISVPTLTATTDAGTAVAIPSPSGLTITGLSTQPLNGTATVSGGVITYIPDAGFTVGVDEFEYVATNGIDIGTNTVTVTVTSTALIARNDVYVVSTNTDVAGNVCANDQFPQAPSACVVTTNGLMTPLPGVAGDGSFTFRSSSTGVYQYRYILNGTAGSVAEAGVTIYVTTRTAVYLKTAYSSAIDSGVLGNLQGGSETPPTYGTSTLLGSGQSNYLRYAPNAGFWGIDRYTYKSTNDNGPVRVLVGPPAVTVPAQAGTAVSESLTDTSFLATQLSRGSFIVDCSGCRFSAQVPATHGVFSINADTGTFTYLPDADTSATSDSVTIRVTDTASPSSENMFRDSTITFTITPDVTANDDAVSLVLGGSPVTVDLAGNDNCGDPGGCEIVVGTLPAGVARSGTSSSFAFTPDVTLGSVTFAYTLRSIAMPSVSDTASVTVNVAGTTPDTVTTAPNQAVTINALANDVCRSASGVSCTLHSVGTPVVGTASISGASIVYTPPAWFAGATTFLYTVSAANGSTATEQITVNVIGAVDDAVTVSSGIATVLDPLANDLCVDCRITGTAAGTIVDNGYGISLTASTGSNFSYTITDANNATSTASVTVTVASPPIAAADSVTTPAGSAGTIDVLANDSRVNGTSCTSAQCDAEIFSDPTNGAASLRADGTLQYSPLGDFAGTDSFTYLVINDFGLTDTATVAVTVNPVAVGDSVTLATGQTNAAVPVMANDICGTCTLSVDSVTGALAAGAVTVNGGSLEIDTPGSAGTAAITYRLTTATGSLSATAVLSVQISDASPDAGTTPADTAVTIDVIANDTLASTVDSVTQPSGAAGSVTFSGVEVTFTPTDGFSGLAVFSYTTSAGTSATVSVLVAPTAIAITTDPSTSVTRTLLPTACPNCLVTVTGSSPVGDLDAATGGPVGDFTFRPASNTAGTTGSISYAITHTPTGLSVSGTLNVTVVASLVAGISLDTSIASTGTVGSTATVTYTVTNSGTAPLSAVTLTDPLTGAFACTIAGASVTHPISTMAAGAVATCTATFTVTQAHMDAGQAVSSGQASATSSTTGPSPATDTATLTLTRTPGITLSKSGSVDLTVAAPTTSLGAGDEVDFTFTVTNSGNVTLTNVTITDPFPGLGSLSCTVASQSVNHPIAQLAPAGVAVCTASAVLTQQQVDAGQVVNSAGVAATAPSGVSDPSATGTVTVPLTTTASVSIGGSASSPVAVTGVGQVVAVTYTITNSGPLSLRTLALDTPLAQTSCTTTNTRSLVDLAPGELTTCIVSHPLTQADIDAGQLAHSATVTGQTVGGAAVTATTSVTVSVTATRSVVIVASATSPAAVTAVGDTVPVTYTVTNDGLLSLRTLELNTLLAQTSCTTTNDRSLVDLAPGAVTSCVVSHPVTQAEIDAGQLVHSAIVTGQTTLGASVTDTDSVTVTITVAPSVAIAGSAASPVTVAGIGAAVPVTFTITNDGLLSLQNLTLTTPSATASCATTSTNALENLASAATTTCTVTRTITQAILDAGQFTQSATVSGESVAGAPTSATGTVTVSVTPTTALVADLTITTTISATATVGSSATVTHVVTNIGTATLTTVTIADPLTGSFTCEISGQQASPAIPHPISQMAPGDVVECIGMFTITQAHLDAGQVTTTATANATSGTVNVADPAQATDTDTATLTATASVAISGSAPPSAAVSESGETVPVTYTITNDGPLSLRTLALDTPLSQTVCATTGTRSLVDLAPGASTTCVVSHPVTQAEVDAGQLVHSATVTGQTVGGTAVTATTSVTVTITLTSTSPPTGTADSGPVLNDDDVSAPMGAIVTVRPLTNDEGDDLRITTISPPSVGTAELVGGNVTIIPPLFHVGPITLTYTATDGQRSGTARITLTMTDTAALVLPEMFLDMDRDGARSTIEPGIPEVEMTLTLTARAEFVATADGSLSASGTGGARRRSGVGALEVATGGCSTDDAGICVPPSMPAGTYQLTVSFDPDVHGLEMTAAPAGTIGLSSGLDLTGLEEVRPAFGFAGPGTIAARVTPEAWVEVVWVGPDRVFDTDDDVIVLVQGDANGGLVVPGLPIGSYVIRPADPPGAMSMTTATRASMNIEVTGGGSGTVTVDATRLTMVGRLPSVGADAGSPALLALLMILLGLSVTAAGIVGERRRPDPDCATRHT